VELLDAPHLRGKPVAVGGYHMLSTTSYEARAFGVRSAMPGFIGKVVLLWLWLWLVPRDAHVRLSVGRNCVPSW
jgi:nucleotidyltransferase/DNA polymerase involved in DNA repair